MLVLAAVAAAVFVGLGVWHFAMAVAPRRRGKATVPHVNGRPLFVPSAAATAGVGVGLMLCALLVLGTAGIVALGAPAPLLTRLSVVLALVLFGRAVGDFRYVGFFKSVHGSRFAAMDTWCYSPLCLVLSVVVGYVAVQRMSP
jgi:hypothetical protein